jgi:tetratricopeptide (TPR) repeat protein
MPLISALCSLMLVFNPAQPGGEAELSRYWSAIRTMSMAEELAAVPFPELERPLRDVAEGLLRLRRFEISGSQAEAARGRRQLELTARRNPDIAWAHFALGLLLARGPDVREAQGHTDRAASAYVVRRHSMAAAQAPRSLRRALELEPRLHDAARAFGDLALDVGTLGLLTEALELLSAHGRDTDAGSLLIRSRVHARLGELGRAAATADAAREFGADPAASRHAAAAALLRAPGREMQGAEEYFRGIDQLSEAAAEDYFLALSALAPKGAASFGSASLAEKRNWLRSFWDVEAGLAGVPVHERLAAHYRRLGRAVADPAVAPTGAVSHVRTSALNLIRHDDPMRALRMLYCTREAMELPLPLQPSVAECLQSPIGRLRALQLVDTGLWMEQATTRSLEGTSYSPPFTAHLAMAWELLQLRGAAGATDVVTAVAVSTASATALVHDGVLAGQLDIAFVDTAGMAVRRHAVPLSLGATALPQGGWILLAATTPTPPFAQLQYRVSVTDRGRSAGAIAGGTISVREHAADTVDLSDILIADSRASSSFARGAVRLSLVPLRDLSGDEVFTLYYEIYGLSEGARFNTEIRVEREGEGLGDSVGILLRGRPAPLRLSFDGYAPTQHEIFGTQQSRTVSLGGLPAGRYRLTIIVTDELTGRTASRARALSVRGIAR